MKNTFFTSDTHYWHKRVIESCNRPFKDLPEMNAALIKNWNARVQPEDEVYCLGDMFFCGVTLAKEILTQLNGTKFWIKGNHDWIKERRANEFGFEWVKDQHELELEGLGRVLLSHYPYRGDHTLEDRYLERRPVDVGGWLFHGHVHCAWRIRERQINVGVDQWDYAPVHLDELVELTKKTP